MWRAWRNEDIHILLFSCNIFMKPTLCYWLSWQSQLWLVNRVGHVHKLWRTHIYNCIGHHFLFYSYWGCTTLHFNPDVQVTRAPTHTHTRFPVCFNYYRTAMYHTHFYWSIHICSILMDTFWTQLNTVETCVHFCPFRPNVRSNVLVLVSET